MRSEADKIRLASFLPASSSRNARKKEAPVSRIRALQSRLRAGRNAEPLVGVRDAASNSRRIAQNDRQQGPVFAVPQRESTVVMMMAAASQVHRYYKKLHLNGRVRNIARGGECFEFHMLLAPQVIHQSLRRHICRCSAKPGIITQVIDIRFLRLRILPKQRGILHASKGSGGL